MHKNVLTSGFYIIFHSKHDNGSLPFHNSGSNKYIYLRTQIYHQIWISYITYAKSITKINICTCSSMYLHLDSISLSALDMYSRPLY